MYEVSSDIEFLSHVKSLSNKGLAEHVKTLEMHQGVHLKEDIKGTSGVINHHHHNFIATQQGFVPLRYIKPYVERNTYLYPSTLTVILTGISENRNCQTCFCVQIHFYYNFLGSYLRRKYS